MKTVDFSENIAASDLKVGRSRHLIYEGMSVLKIKVISSPWSKIVYIQNLNRIFSENTVPF